jgi:hypothetical protein
LVADDFRQALVQAFGALGFSAVGLDLEGLVSGKLNRDLSSNKNYGDPKKGSPPLG